MKKIVIGIALVFIFFACTDTAGDADKDNRVDTSVIGSDNPNPLPGSSVTGNNTDSIKIK